MRRGTGARTWGWAAAAALAAALAAGCGEGGGGGPPPGKSFDELVAAGTCPVEVTGISRSMGPVPAFRGTIRNLSDRPISMLQWTVVFTGADGKAVGEPAEGGYGEVSPIGPGEEIEGMFPAPDDSATAARIVVRDVVSMKPNPLGEKFGDLPYRWVNPRHDDDVRAAGGK